MKTVKMDIQGMHCGGCATGIEMVTQGMDGVESTKVDYDGGVGEFTFDENVTNEEAIIAEIGKLEYTATVSGGEAAA